MKKHSFSDITSSQVKPQDLIGLTVPYFPTEVPTAAVPLPLGHRFFPDCYRECYARFIEWGLWCGHPKPDVWFVSVTFKRNVSGYRAWGLLSGWLRRLKEGYKHKGGLELRWICATEWQLRGVIHFHLLIAGVGLSELSRKRWEVRWETSDRNTGYCRIYDADRKAAPYLAKYIRKGSELQTGGYWRGLKARRSVTCCRPSAPVYHPDASRSSSQV